MLAALAIAVTLPKVGIHFGGMDLGQFIVMFLGGMIGVILMRFAATWFVELLNKYPGLEGAAFAIVGWVGIKLIIMVLAHPDIGVLPEAFPHSALWQTIFWVVLVGLVLIGWLTSAIGNKKKVIKNNLIDMLEPLLNNNLSGGSFILFLLEHCSFIVKILNFRL